MAIGRGLQVGEVAIAESAHYFDSGQGIMQLDVKTLFVFGFSVSAGGPSRVRPR